MDIECQLQLSALWPSTILENNASISIKQKTLLIPNV